jgi:hypothetical protein
LRTFGKTSSSSEAPSTESFDGLEDDDDDDDELLFSLASDELP